MEPACGAAIAPLYDHAPELAQYQSVLVVVCGGVTASVEQVQQMLERLGGSDPSAK